MKILKNSLRNRLNRPNDHRRMLKIKSKLFDLLFFKLMLKKLFNLSLDSLKVFSNCLRQLLGRKCSFKDLKNFLPFNILSVRVRDSSDGIGLPMKVLNLTGNNP
ncbi:hypothetical protein BpHYR1_045573 [Brachionus plicatilis]|uniref:Uncharacterized protein n=1 Tax=Brachionus plicatilis TaxID=10195 RepID=A0A3M7QMW3_BRAPC|nr:hypothetical protein BpHYR1_045573 [Brachionus plicatilis]